MFVSRIVIFFVAAKSILASVPRLDDRIVGGQNASILKYPYQISLRRFNNHICGGSIFHDMYILTAAHCVAGGVASQFSIRAGSNFVNKGGKRIKVCTIISHEDYDVTTLDNDIAILKTCTPLPFSDSILPVALPEAGEEVTANSKAVVTGWGYEAEGGILSSVLKQVEVPIIAQNICVKTYAKYADITSNMLCAGIKNVGGKDACQGDSGGPLRTNGKLMGVVSWGFGCARPEYPGVYTKVSNYRSWIKRMTNY